jgi:hypothetical protein
LIYCYDIDTNEEYKLKLHLEIFEKWWCGPFALGLIFSPPLALIAKNRERWSPSYFLPIGTSKYE